MIYTVLISLILIASVLLILVVLVQNSKGGMSDQFTGATSQIGAKNSTELIEKITWVLASVVLIGSLMVNILADKNDGKKDFLNPSLKKAVEKEATAPKNTKTEGTKQEGAKSEGKVETKEEPKK